MRIAAIVQARMGSQRMPQKVLANVCGHSVLWHIYNRVRYCRTIDYFQIATSVLPQDDRIESFALQYGIPVYRGSEENVLERYYLAARKEEADIVVRLTGDNILIFPELIDAGVEYFKNEIGLDYLYYREGLPLGSAVEIMTFSALEQAYLNAVDAECLEHVTPYLYLNPEIFNCYRYPCQEDDYSSFRWTMDTAEDYELLKKMYGSLFIEGECFGYQEALREYQKHTDWMNLNCSVKQKGIRYQGERSSVFVENKILPQKGKDNILL